MMWCFNAAMLREALDRWLTQPGRPVAAQDIVAQFLGSQEAEKLRVRQSPTRDHGERTDADPA